MVLPGAASAAAGAPPVAADYRLDDLPDVIARQIAIDPQTGEWIWTGHLDRDGYGRFGGEGVHRLVYTALVAPIAPGLEIDHVREWGCTSRACCSPWHMQPVTSRVNTLRGTSFAAVNAAKARCDSGHEFDLLNTYWRPNGHRDCRKCTARRQREYQRRLKECASPASAERRAA